MEILQMNIDELLKSLHSRKISSEELVKFYLDRIEKYDHAINAFMTINENAIKEAKRFDEKRGKNESLPLYAGIPIALKDNIITKGINTTCSSKILEGFNPPYDSTVSKLLKENGFIILGKLNMDEFAMGSSTETSYYKKTRNPWDLERVPGGSSGGAASAMAAGLAPVTLGSDTGGSIRQPASFCGVCGLKPTYGRVSRYGLVAFASSLDQIGPFSRDIADSAHVLSVIGKYDESDSTSFNTPQKDYNALINTDIRGKKIGIPKEYFMSGIEDEVLKSVEDAISVYRKIGGEIVEVSMPHTEYAVAVYYIIATAEASSNLARYDGVRFSYRENAEGLIDMYESTRSKGFGKEVKRRIMLGTYVLSAGYYDAYYLKAQKVRTLIKNDFEEAFKKVDVILTPTSPNTAFKFGEKMDDPVSMYLSDIFTISLNLFGGCGVSVPCGFDRKGLPVGFQLMGDYFKEDKIFSFAKAYQDNTDWHKKYPKLF